jgi:hypothetical protein
MGNVLDLDRLLHQVDHVLHVDEAFLNHSEKVDAMSQHFWAMIFINHPRAMSDFSFCVKSLKTFNYNFMVLVM